MPGATPAITAAVAAKVRHDVHEVGHDPAVTAYGREAAAALGVTEDRVFKTLIADTGSELLVAVVPVSHELDLKALASAAGAKSAKMADPAAAERSSGYVVGGISPVGQKKRLRTYLDLSAATFDTVFVSAGRRGLELEMDPADLLRLTSGHLAAIARAR